MGVINMLEIIQKLGRSNNKIILFIKQILTIFLYIILTISLQLLFLNSLKNSNIYVINLCYIFIDLIILIIFLILFKEIIVPDFYDFKKNGKDNIKKTYHYYIIGLLIMLISNIIISNFMGMPENEEANREILGLLPYYSIINLIIIAPITEELMTRVILKKCFKHTIFYIILSGFIFGFLHVVLSISDNPLELLYIIPYSALGCALAKIYEKSNNVWTNIFFHSFHNLICILIIFLGA